MNEALNIIALEVVGVTNPADVHDDEMLRWGDIRKALETYRVYEFRPGINTVKELVPSDVLRASTPQNPVYIKSENGFYYTVFACPGGHPAASSDCIHVTAKVD